MPPSTTDAPVTRVEARRGAKPRKVQVEGAPRAAQELRDDPDKYTEIFGARVPAPTTVADSLAYSAGWSAALAEADRWRAYCAAQNRAAWGHSLGLLERLEATAQAPGSTAPADLPELTAVISARAASAKRGAITRRERKAAKDAQVSATPETPTK